VSQILHEGGGDGSDFALALAALVHSLGARVRLSVVCASAEGTSSGKHCRLLTEARVGYTPHRAAEWVGKRHASGQAGAGLEPPDVHYRREPDGATWLSLTWQGGDVYKYEPMPGGAYVPAGMSGPVEWTTFYPFDEHGCKWHVDGMDSDSTGRSHSSAPVRSIPAGSGHRRAA
jgi:hypothetical protein